MAERSMAGASPSAARILIVDDEPNIRSSLTRALNLLGYKAESAASGPEALARLKQAPCDLMVLDMVMPGMHGTEVMQQAKKMRPELLIIVLTGNATLESAIAALKSHATDYLLKPVRTPMLAAVIAEALQERTGRMLKHNHLRTAVEALEEVEMLERQLGDETAGPESRERGAGRAEPRRSTGPLDLRRVLQVGPLILDRQKRLVLSMGAQTRTRELTRGEADILAVLMTCPDQVLTSRELVRAAWGYEMEEAESGNLVRPYISRIRQKIEGDPGALQLIQTIRGRGYLLSVK